MHLQPKAIAALLAAYASQGKRLHRTRGGFAGLPAEIKTSGAVTTQVFTRRVINWLDDAYLVTFDDPDFPHTVTLNARGIAHAEQLLAQHAAMEKAS